MRLSAKLGCSYVSTWQSPFPLTVVEQGRLAIELSDGSGQGASALLTSSPRVEGRRGGRRSRPQGAAPADWLLAEGGLREACDG